MSTRRKFVIKPFSTVSQYDAGKIRETWDKLKKASESILVGTSLEELSFETLYRSAYNLVLHKHGKTLYEGIQKVIRTYLQGTVAPEVARQPEEHILPALHEQWKRHLTTSRMMSDYLMYLDRSYVIPHKLRPVMDMAVLEFRDHVLRHADVPARVTDQLMATIARARGGEAVDGSLMRGSLNMLVRMGVYDSVFEGRFLEETDDFYRAESSDVLAASSCSDYLRKAEARIAEERTRVQDYLTDATGQRLRSVVERRLIAEHTTAMVEMDSGAISMMDASRTDELASMYRLFGMVRTTAAHVIPVRSGGHDTGSSVTKQMTPMGILRHSFQRHIEEDGAALVADTEEAKNPVRFVGRLLDMHAHYADIVRDSFDGDRQMQRSMKEAFEFFVNVDGRCAQFLSLFLDAEFRQGFKTKAPEEIDETLTAVITAFRFVKDKDVFESFYKQHLQRRLLTGRTVNDDAERSMIAKLKAECGPQFTSKMEGMFADLATSRQQMLRYRRDTGSSRGVALDVTILTTVHWPNLSGTPCSLPAPVQPVADGFKDWYLSRHTGRRLEWSTAQGTADVSMLCAARRYELVVSTYQMCILELFNASETCTFGRIRAETGIPEAELKRHLVSLCTPAARVLIKRKKGKAIEDADEFSANAKFKSAKIRNRIKLVTLKSALGGSKASSGVPEQVAMARRSMMDAALVRIMKARKVLKHAELISEAVRMLCHRFTPKPADLKARVENLIDRDYLSRSEEDMRTYEYVA